MRRKRTTGKGSVFDEYPEVTLLLRHWINGGSALRAVKKLVECGYPDEAAATARVALRTPDCVASHGSSMNPDVAPDRI